MAEQYNVNGVMNESDTTIEDQKQAAFAAYIAYLTQKLQEELPQEQYSSVQRRRIAMPMPDGISLDSVVYMPAGDAAWPVILQRCPYGPVDFPETDTVGEIFAKRGYAYCIVRCRGTGRSEGRINAFEQETDDGLAVIDFVASQPWCDGNIGTYGASYMGHSQWAVANCRNPALKTMYIQVFGAHAYESFYRAGMLRQDIWQSWVTGNGGDARDRTPEEALRLHQQAFDLKPKSKIGQLVNDPVEWGVKIITNPEECNDAWQTGFWKTYEDNARKLSLPILLQCGWFDLFCQSQIDAWRFLPETTRQKSLCLIGPWDHYGFTNRVLPYPGQEQFGVMQIKTALQWFDHFLKGAPLVLPTGGVQAYTIGDDRWQFWQDDFAGSDSVTFYLADNALQPSPGASGEITYSYDPENPVASLALGLEKGTVIMPAPGQRENVFSFVSAPLERDVCLTGSMVAQLYVSSSAEATAFTITLVDERTDGNGYMVLNDIADIRYEKDHFETYTPGKIKKIAIRTPDILWTFKAGSKIRIDISSSDFPWFNAHTNTAINWGHATESVISQNTVFFGAGMPSCIMLPVSTGV